MPPKKASASKKEPKKANVAFENRKEEILEEAEERLEHMRAWIKNREQQMFQEMQQIISGLDPALLKMTLGEFMAMPVTNDEDTKENEDAMRTAREQTVANEVVVPNQIQETAVRPQKNGRVMELKTPAGNAFKVPSFITPRVGGGSLETRTIRPDEVGFSAAGSPIVLGQARRGEGNESNQAFEQFQQMVNADEQELTPNARQVVRTIKAFMQKKPVGDPV